MEGNSITSYENLCKIFEMRIKLDQEKGVKTPLEVLNNYEKYSKKIDAIYNSEFQKELKPLISPAVTLEKEEDRLRRLIKLLEDRLDKRVKLEDRFYSVTGRYITDLQIIVSEEELDNKKDRLALVSRYLEVSSEIEEVTESTHKLRDSLNEELDKKEEYESKNKIMEDELYSSFMDIVKKDEYLKSLNEEDINTELDEIRCKVAETKETLDITRESVGSLLKSGLEDDYTSYVEEAERSYYNYKNKELNLKIYKLVINFEDDFKQMCSKREKISSLLEEKKNLRNNLSIEVEDEMFTFEKIVLVQDKTLDSEREVLENINNYTSRIKFKEERLEELNEANSTVEILALLREYGLIDTYDTEEIDIETTSIEDAGTYIDSEDIDANIQEIIEPEIISEVVYDPYTIVEVKDYPKTLNIGLAKLKGESVREKVNKKLNPKEDISLSENSTLNQEESNDYISEPIIPIEEINGNYTEPPLMEEVGTINMESNTINKEDEQLPITEVPKEKVSESTNIKIDSPVWEIPVETEIKPVSIEEENTNNIPIWDAITPSFDIPKKLDNEEISSIDITMLPNDNINNSPFWTPVSESKLDTKDFPNINIPFNNNKGINSFDFPTINN